MFWYYYEPKGAHGDSEIGEAIRVKHYKKCASLDQNLVFGLACDITNERNIDSDASAVCLDSSLSQVEIISYNHLRSNDWYIQHGKFRPFTARRLYGAIKNGPWTMARTIPRTQCRECLNSRWISEHTVATFTAWSTFECTVCITQMAAFVRNFISAVKTRP